MVVILKVGSALTHEDPTTRNLSSIFWNNGSGGAAIVASDVNIGMLTVYVNSHPVFTDGEMFLTF